MHQVPVLVVSALPKQHQKQFATFGRTLHIAAKTARNDIQTTLLKLYNNSIRTITHNPSKMLNASNQ